MEYNQGIKISATTADRLNDGYSEGQTSVTYPIQFNGFLGYVSGLVDSSSTFIEQASFKADKNSATAFLHALNKTSVDISAWLFVFGY